MFLASDWKDFKVLDTGDGEKLERWREILLIRPDPQVIWPKSRPELWKDAHARYRRASSGGGSWEVRKKIPDQWEVTFKGLRFAVKPMGFKHTGLFPEQAVNWQWMQNKIETSSVRPFRVLNLFAYTGGATVACVKAGAEVCHVDASKGMVQWAKENLELSGLGDRKARFLVDDAKKFVQREIRRGKQYEAVVMDPPSYGRGPGGELWKIEDEIYELVGLCTELLSPDAQFFVLNGYTTGLQPQVLANLLTLHLRDKFGGRVSADEIGLPIKNSEVILPSGATGRWERTEA